MPTFPSGFSPSPIPMIAFGVALGVGPANDAPPGLKTLLLASRTSGGSASDAVPVECFGIEDLEAKAGPRSRLALLGRAFRAIAPRGQLFACPVPEPVAGTAATAVLAFSGPATGAGVLRGRIAGQLLRELVLPSGTTANAAAALAQAWIAEVSTLPCTGTVGGTGHEAELTLTAANVGQVGHQLRVVFEVTAPGITISLNGEAPATRGKGYFGAGTSTPGVGTVSLTATLAAVAGARYDRIVVDVDDDVNRAAVVAHLRAQSGINTGHRCMAAMGSLLDSTSTVQSDAVAMQEPRALLLHGRRSHRTAGEIAAAFMAASIYGDGRLLGEGQYRAAKHNGLSLYPAIEATDEEERLDVPSIESLMRSGVTVLGADPLHPGYACVIRPVTTRTQNAHGGMSYLVAAPSKVRVADLVADRCEAFASANYADKNLVPDPASIETAPASPYVIWRSAIRDDMLSILRQMEDEALLVNVSEHAAAVSVETTTVEGVTYAVVKVPFDVIPHLDSVIGEAQQIG